MPMLGREPAAIGDPVVEQIADVIHAQRGLVYDTCVEYAQAVVDAIPSDVSMNGWREELEEIEEEL